MILFVTPLWGGGNYLRSSQLIDNELHLQFKSSIKSVNAFTIPAQGYTKYVYDIQGGVLPKGQSLPYDHAAVKNFRIGQYNKQTLRIVIESSHRITKSHQIQGKKLIIPLLPEGQTLQSAKAFKPLRVAIDAGHGGKDGGAVCCGIKEKQITLVVSKKLQTKLQAKGYEVYMTRSRDRFRSLRQRTEDANAQQVDIFISIHANAAPPRKRKRLNGIEVFSLSLKNSRKVKNHTIRYKGKPIYGQKEYQLLTDPKKINYAKILARKVQKQIDHVMKSGYSNINSELKRKDFWVLLGTNMPAILVEIGYLTHQKDRERLESEQYQNLMVDGIAEGVDNYFKGKN